MRNLTEIGKMKQFLIFLFLICSHFSFTQVTLDWEMYHPTQKTWLPFGQAGTVQEYLWQRGELPDPFYGENEAKYQWIEDHVWHFRSRFFLNEAFFNETHLILDIPNLDTYAQVFLNGKLLAQSENFFLHYNFTLEVKDLQCGYNTIDIKIESPVQYHAKSELYKTFTYPAPNDVGSTKVASLTRKPQYHFGWDWAPRINTIGFAYPITIDLPPNIQVEHIVVNTITLNNDGSAQIQLKGRISTKQQGISVKSQLLNHVQVLASIERTSSFQAASDSSLFQFDLDQYFTLPNAQLWWPAGHGLPHLYQDTLSFYDSSGQLVHQHPFQFGIRQSKLLQEQDEWGTSFVFEINGRKIFAKGANLIPPGLFAGPSLDSAFVALVPEMQAAHFNIVRVWGGGMYAPSSFMEACDRAGIMVWHDFMFACAMYPGAASFLTLVTEEVKQQIPRLAAHPSLVYFNGNNEVDVAWRNWGFQNQYHLNEAAQQEIEEAYQKLFRQVLPWHVNELTTGSIPYVHTSPLSNWGKDEYFNYGTMHYWGVWHGKDPLHDFANKIGRFNAEYGFQSFPELSTINRFAPLSEQSLYSSIMKTHQKSYVGNGMIEKHAKIYFGKAKDFQTFIYYSQLTQRKAVSIAVAGHRADAPRCMGTIFWQLNDCWPAPTWSSLDDHNNWKALHYAAKEDYRAIAVLELIKEDSHFLVLCSDLPDDTLITVELQFYDVQGIFVKNDRRTYPLQQYKTQVLTFINDDYSGFVKVILDDKYERLFSFIDKRKAPETQLTFQIELQDATTNSAVLVIETQEPLVDLWIFSKEQELHFEQNFQTLLPGKHRMEFTYKTQLPRVEQISYLLR